MNFDTNAIPDLVAEAIGVVLRSVVCVGVIAIGLYFFARWFIGRE